MANPAAGCYNVGGVDLPCTWSIFDVFDKFVWTPARNAAASSKSDSLATWVPPKRVVPINIPNPFDKYVDDPVERVDTTYTPGHWTYPPAPFVNITTNPQNPRRLTPEQHQILRHDFEELLRGRKDCEEFARRLLLTAAINTQRTLYKNTFVNNPVEILDEVEKQGGVALSDPTSRYGGTASGSLGGNDKLEATMELNNLSWQGASWVRGDAVFHESAHFAPAQGVFSDRELA